MHHGGIRQQVGQRGAWVALGGGLRGAQGWQPHGDGAPRDRGDGDAQAAQGRDGGEREAALVLGDPAGGQVPGWRGRGPDRTRAAGGGSAAGALQPAQHLRVVHVRRHGRADDAGGVHPADQQLRGRRR